MAFLLLQEEEEDDKEFNMSDIARLSAKTGKKKGEGKGARGFVIPEKYVSLLLELRNSITPFLQL